MIECSPAQNLGRFLSLVRSQLQEGFLRLLRLEHTASQLRVWEGTFHKWSLLHTWWPKGRTPHLSRLSLKKDISAHKPLKSCSIITHALTGQGKEPGEMESTFSTHTISFSFCPRKPSYRILSCVPQELIQASSSSAQLFWGSSIGDGHGLFQCWLPIKSLAIIGTCRQNQPAPWQSSF